MAEERVAKLEGARSSLTASHLLAQRQLQHLLQCRSLTIITVRTTEIGSRSTADGFSEPVAPLRPSPCPADCPLSVGADEVFLSSPSNNRALRSRLTEGIHGIRPHLLQIHYMEIGGQRI